MKPKKDLSKEHDLHLFYNKLNNKTLNSNLDL